MTHPATITVTDPLPAWRRWGVVALTAWLVLLFLAINNPDLPLASVRVAGLEAVLAGYAIAVLALPDRVRLTFPPGPGDAPAEGGGR